VCWSATRRIRNDGDRAQLFVSANAGRPSRGGADARGPAWLHSALDHSHVMTKSEKDWWQQVRAKGRSQFIFREGLLRRGLPFGVFMTVAMLVIDLITRTPIEPAWKLAVEFAFYTLAFGYGMGSTTWSDRERELQEETDDDDVV
jgi:hypothetical protein